MDRFSDPHADEIMMQRGQTIEIGRIVEHLRDILKVFPGVGPGHVDDPVVRIGEIPWIVRRLS
ncbi:MAG: hypothetical protein DYH03_15615 [Nitrospira sp. NTP1]|nr:hypothetical protein [Nitrospira sp. NTP1]